MATEQMLIGLYSPAAQSGKSTVAGILRANHGFETKSFATALKRMVADLLYSTGFSPEDVGRIMDVDKEAPIPELGDRSFRQLAQTLGTEWGRYLVDKDIWVKVLMNAPERPNLLVIDDVRFENEYEAIKADGGQVWRITRPGVEIATAHISEGALDGFEFDEEIINDGSYDDLEAKVKTALLG